MPTPFGPVVDVFCFVPDLTAASTWYTARLGVRPTWQTRRLASFDLDGSRLTLHVEDGWDTGCPGGSVAYWDVADVDRVAEEWTRHGAAAHRGPMTIATGERLCQLRDPFGNLIGVRQAPVPAMHRGDAPVPMKGSSRGRAPVGLPDVNAFDTARVPAAERARLVVSLLEESVRCRVTLLGDASAVQARWSRHQLSPGAGVCCYAGSAVRFTRRDADVLARPAQRLAFLVPGSAGSTLWQAGQLRRLDAGEMVLVDEGSPYDYRGRAGMLSVVQLDLLVLGTTARGARAAAPWLRSSSLYDLARDHGCPVPADHQDPAGSPILGRQSGPEGTP